MTKTTEKTTAKKEKKARITAYEYSQVDKLIMGVERDGESLKTKIHSIAICLLSHWANNPTAGLEVAEKMTALQNASPYHSKSFADWVAVQCNMKWAEDTKRWYVQKDQKFKKPQLDAAKSNPFWTVSPPQAAKPLTNEAIIKILEGILAKQEKHEKNPVADDNFSTAGNEGIRTAINALKA